VRIFTRAAYPYWVIVFLVVCLAIGSEVRQSRQQVAGIQGVAATPVGREPSADDLLAASPLDSLGREGMASATTPIEQDERGPVIEAGGEEALRPWLEVREEFRKMCAHYDDSNKKSMLLQSVKWSLRTGGGEPGQPDFESEALNPNGKSIGPFDKEQLQAIVDDYNAALQFMGEEAAIIEKASVESYFDQGMYIRYETKLDMPAPPFPAGGKWCRLSKIASHGWTVYTRFSSDDFPELDLQMEGIEALKADRLQAVANYIKGI
jgi:hypothetical protein